MFKPKGLFSDITCPYNQECVLPQCFFAHREDDAGASLATNGTPDSLSTTASKEERVELSDDGPRKRRKVSGAIIPPPTTSKQHAAVDKNVAAPRLASSSETAPASKPLVSSQRRASPPLTKRQSNLKGDENAQTTARSAVAVSKQKPAAAQKPIKAETLNPRMLSSSKTPHNVRLKLVQLLHEQLTRLNTELSKDASDAELSLVLSPQALITMALDIEERAGLEKAAIHSSAVKNTILRYRKMGVADWAKERKVELDRGKARAEAAAGKPPTKENKPIVTGLPRDLEIVLLSKLQTPAPSEHGFVNAVISEDAVNKAKSGVEAAQGWEQCDRCRTRFQVFPERRESDGILCGGGSCTYHFGKAFFPEKSATDVKGTKREKRYRCCGEALGDSSGCTTAATHVFKVTDPKRLATILNFIETPENSKADEDLPLAMDAEMGYSTLGLELIRLTATSWPAGDPVLDILVRPFGEVLDLNSRWSGVLPFHLTEAPLLKKDPKTNDYNAKQLAGSERLHIVESPAVARDVLLRFLTPRIPLIGHGLENDLNSVRLIHPTIIDTALLFPHKIGLPYRNALRALVQQHLGRTIQSGGGVMGTDKDSITTGHSSLEDARSAGGLVLWAVKREWEKMKAMGWRLAEGRLVAPKVPSNWDLNNKVKVEVAKVGEKRKVDELEEDSKAAVGE